MLKKGLTICFFTSVLFAYPAIDQPLFAQSSSLLPAVSPVEFVLLDNGRVLKGRVTRTPDQVHVGTNEGSRIVLSAKKVDSIHGSMEEVWQQRHSTLSAGDVPGHLSLFHWCVKHRLRDAALTQLDHLMQSDVDVRRLKSLDMQMARAFERDALPRVTKTELGKFDEPSVANLTFRPLPPLDSVEDLPPDLIVDHAISLASHTESASVVQTANESEKNVPDVIETPVHTDLDSTTDLLTREDLHQFQRRVQPVLLKGCLAAKCHNSVAATMPLMHRGHGQLVPKRFTQRNLQSIFAWVNAEDVLSSQLLHRASVPHGNQDVPALERDSEEFKRLSKWVQSAVKNSPALFQPHGATTSARSTTPTTPNLASKQGSGPVTTHQRDRKVDPFDPAAFNQLSQ